MSGAGKGGPDETVTVVGHRPPRRDPNELTVVTGGKTFGGWQDVRVTRGVERMPGDFEILLTERYPGQAGAVALEPGADCVVYLGNDRVITGYIDRIAPSLSPASHAVRASGRGKCQDLVDCSAMVKGAQVSGTTVLQLMTDLAAPFGIDVSAVGDVGDVQTPQFNVNLGETPFEIIDRVARWAQLLVYEDTFGNLVLSQVGTITAASGFQQGLNVQAASATFSMDERFSVYTAVLMSVDKLSDIGDGGNTISSVTDSTVPRFRPKIIVSEQTQNGVNIAEKRLNWEKARRIGRSQAFEVTADSWRDSAGALWTPNTLVPVDAPALKLVSRRWVIGEVTYARGEGGGTTASLTIMPQAAYQPEPNVLQAFDWQVAQALPSGGATK